MQPISALLAEPLSSDAAEFARKTYHGGTHRLVAPSVTLSRMMRFMAPMGITRIADITGLDRIGVPVAMCIRPNSRSLAVAQGKGVNPEAAKASAVMESIESYHAERVTAPLRLATYAELRSEFRVVDIEQLPRVSHQPFDSNVPLLWVEGYDLLRMESIWLPLEIVHTHYTVTMTPASGYFQCTSNGLGSGNHILEAINHGICEIVERDAWALWSMSDVETQANSLIDADTVTDSLCRDILDKYQIAKMNVRIVDIASDIGIPAFGCLLYDPLGNGRAGDAVSGMGCHPSREVALLRALTEAAQVRLTYIAGSRDDIPGQRYEPWRSTVHHVNGAGSMDGPTRGNKDFNKGPNWCGETLQEDTRWILDRLRSIEVEAVIAVTLTKPEIGIPVVRLVIPGLEGVSFMQGYTPGSRGRALLSNVR